MTTLQHFQDKPHYYQVNYGSPALNQLRRGDNIMKIDNYDARDMRHQDANNLIKNSGKEIKIVVERNNGGANFKCPSSQSSHSASPLLMSPNSYQSLRPLTPSKGEPFQNMNDSYIQYIPEIAVLTEREEEAIIENVENQPYRTTPLVLAGPKIRHEPEKNDCWLRHYPNPIARASPIHLDALSQQKVADSFLQNVPHTNLGGKQIVHKQFNSPIQMYNDENIATTFKQHTGLTPPNDGSIRSPAVFDPSKSETLRALHEEEFMKNSRNPANSIQQPVHTKVFVRQKSPRPVTTTGPASNNIRSYIYPIADSEENIQQSGSFKRLMYSVL